MSSFASRWISVFFAINGRQKGDSGGCWLSSGNHSGSLRNYSGSFGKRRWSFGEGCGSLRNCCGRLADRRGRLQSWLKSLPERPKPARLRRGKAVFWGQDTPACATNSGATIRDSKTHPPNVAASRQSAAKPWESKVDFTIRSGSGRMGDVQVTLQRGGVG